MRLRILPSQILRRSRGPDAGALQAPGARRRRRVRPDVCRGADRAGASPRGAKVIKLDMDTKQVVARFETERQALTGSLANSPGSLGLIQQSFTAFPGLRVLGPVDMVAP